MAVSPTQLTLKQLRKEGWTCAIVEHWNSFAKIRQDLFGFGDILAIPDPSFKEGKPLIIQCSTLSNIPARRNKIALSPLAKLWKNFGWIEVWGWSLIKKKWAAKIFTPVWSNDKVEWIQRECL